MIVKSRRRISERFQQQCDILINDNAKEMETVLYHIPLLTKVDWTKTKETPAAVAGRDRPHSMAKEYIEKKATVTASRIHSLIARHGGTNDEKNQGTMMGAE